MRLLDVATAEIWKKSDLEKKNLLKQHGTYAIVSHRWTDSEITFEKFETLDGELSSELSREERRDLREKELGNPEKFDHISQRGLAKIARACSLARKDGIPYIWIDTCCINKGPGSNSSEVSQDINSMFRYYKEAQVCYTFLLDVSDNESERHYDGDNKVRAFKQSEWFTRGWTLQELLAPRELRFFDYCWRPIKTKKDRSAEIHEASRIDPRYLNGDFTGACIAVKMSWISGRTTSIRDDMAYCLLGIFGISMNAIYGEEEAAFLRLEEELVKKFKDESIFAWTIGNPLGLANTHVQQSHGLLAPWPSCFRNSDDLTIDCNKLYKERNGVGYDVIRQGIEFQIPGRLPDHGNGVEWNTRTANRRQNYELGLNCWRKGQEKRGSVTIDLWKDGRGQWRRVNVYNLKLDHKLRKSFISFFPTTRPYLMPHKVPGDDDWDRILADALDQELESTQRSLMQWAMLCQAPYLQRTSVIYETRRLPLSRSI